MARASRFCFNKQSLFKHVRALDARVHRAVVRLLHHAQFVQQNVNEPTVLGISVSIVDVGHACRFAVVSVDGRVVVDVVATAAAAAPNSPPPPITARLVDGIGLYGKRQDGITAVSEYAS